MIEENRYTIEKHVAITAGAGSGKTYTLSRRYINALLGFDFFTVTKEPKIPESIEDAKKLSAMPIGIVTTTFTEAGAMEMRSRIEELISLMIRIIDDPDLKLNGSEASELQAQLEFVKDEKLQSYMRGKLQDSLETIHLSIISTIHKFALSIIKQNVELVPMDTTIDVVDEATKQEMFDKIWFKAINKHQDLFLKLDETYSIFNTKSFASRYTFDSRIRDGFDTFINNLGKNKNLDHIYLKLFFKANIQSIIKTFEDYEKTDKKSEKFEKVLAEYLNSIFKLKGSGLVELAGEKKSVKGYTGIKNIFDSVLVFDNEILFKETITDIAKIIKEIRQEYSRQIQTEGKLDFDRILEAASRLVSDKKANLKTYKYFFVDEFQDTNYTQWELIKKSSRLDSDTSANIFLVGDEKQSIFEFQGAEVSTFKIAIEEIKKLKGDDSIITPAMSVNYRSDKYIIDFVNSTFENIMVKDSDIPDKSNFNNEIIQKFIDNVYDNYLIDINNDHEVSYQKLSSNSENNGTVRVLVKQTPILDGPEKLSKYNTESKALHEANMLAYFINEMQDGKYDQYQDIISLLKDNKKAIAILCDSKKHMLLIKNALKKYGLESKVSASEDFYEAQEVIDIFYVIAMIKYLKEDKDLSIIYNEQKDPKIDLKNSINQQKRFFLSGALRSSILRYSDDKIAHIINTDEIPEDILELISLHEVLSLSDLVTYIVEKYEVKRVYAHFDDYPQKVANIKKLIQIATDFKPLYKTPLEEFVETLEKRVLENDGASEEQAFYESEQTNTIEIRTMHSSKGLAWPMVIVPELGATLQGKTNLLNYASYIQNKERLDLVGFAINGAKNISNEIAKIIANQKKYAEKKRLLYVAMTRPESHLVLSVAKNDKGKIEANSYWSRWLENLDIKENKEDKSYKKIKIENNSFIDTKSTFKKYIKIKEENEERFVDINIELYDNTLEKGIDTPALEDDPKPLKEMILEKVEIETSEIEQDLSTINIENIFLPNKAADFGTLAHLSLELGFEKFDTKYEDSFIDEFILTHKVKEEQRLRDAINNFKKSVIFKELKKADIVKFEQEYNFFDKEKNYNQKRIIDLLYFYNGKWNIVDFKSNSLTDRTKEDIIQEHNYSEQLSGYYNYVAINFGEENISRCEILWLEDGTLSNMIGER